MANDIYPPDYSTDVGKIRMLIADRKQYDYENDNKLSYRIPDAQIEAHLEMTDGKLYSAAADIIMSIATDEGLISKVIRTEDLQTDGAKLATELRLQARDLNAKQTAQDEKEASKDAFVYLPMGYPYSNPDR